MIEQSVSIDLPNHEGVTPLFFALKTCNLQLLKLILRCKPSLAMPDHGVLSSDDLVLSPLFPIFFHCKTDMLLALLSAGVCVDEHLIQFSQTVAALPGCNPLESRFIKGLLQAANPSSLSISFADCNLSPEMAANVIFHRKTAVQTIDFSRNPLLTSIPLSLSQLPETLGPSIRRIKFDGCALSGLELSVSRESPLHIIKHARLLSRGRAVALNEIKLVVVGAAAAGKTSLLRRLRGDSFRSELLSTDGIDLGTLKIGDLTFNTYDFGGQTVYRYTHMLFLSDRSMYLLLFRFVIFFNITFFKINFLYSFYIFIYSF